MTAVSIQSVSKAFGAYTALHDISLDVAQGDFFALLGGVLKSVLAAANDEAAPAGFAFSCFGFFFSRLLLC